MLSLVHFNGPVRVQVSHFFSQSDKPIKTNANIERTQSVRKRVVQLRRSPTKSAVHCLCFDRLFVCLFGGVSKAGEIRTLPKTSLPVAVLRVAKRRIP